MNIQSMRDLVSRIYYTYGLFCASHPFAIIVCVSITVIITCYPLSNLPLSGNTPIEHRTSRVNFAIPSGEEPKAPRWFLREPVAYVQQILLKSSVSPWRHQHMMPSDAFRAPLASAFDILNQLDTFQTEIDGKEVALSDMCYRVSEPVGTRHLKGLLPEYACFIVSPANFWGQDVGRFNKDADLTMTVHKKHGPVVESPPTTKDLFFGVPWSETGISRYYIRNRQRVISFAVTIVMKKYDARFTAALLKWMEDHHPDTAHNVNNSEVEDIVHFHFKDTNYIIEYTPLLVTYLLLLLYLYFSVRKIDMVKSKIGLAFSAVVTVVASLMMSVSTCTLFGMTPTLNGGEIFPYLVVIIGVENVLVITKSVVSTPVHLDVKIRVAQGLSREGWYITKNLFTELAIMFVGFFTFVPAIQEFCAFALVGVLSDYYLQMTFFATVLSVDIRRMELSDLARQSVQQAVQQEDSDNFCSIEPLVRCPFVSAPSSNSGKGKSRLSSHHRHSSADFSTYSLQQSPPSSRQGRAYSHYGSSAPKYEMPRRIKVFYFIAKFRLVQKFIMVCTVIWIILFLYKAGLVDKFTGDQEVPETWNRLPAGQPHPFEPAASASVVGPRPEDEGVSPSSPHSRGAFTEDEPQAGLVEHTDLELWRKLSPMHWPRLLRCFNISLSGRYISILPVIHLSDVIDPLVAIEMRHPIDKATMAAKPSFTHQMSYNGDSKIAENESEKQHHYYHDKFDKFYPKSRHEFIVTVILCILSVIVITYFMTMLYRCMCSRNYSRWRHSWARSGRRSRNRGYFKQIKESVPLVLSGHTQTIECLLGENGLIISCCLGGHLKIWDSNSGQCINTISRKTPIPPCRRKPCVGRNIEDSDADLYAEYHGGLGSRSSSDTSLNIGSGEDPGLGSDGRGDGVRIRKGRHISPSSNPDLPSMWRGDKRMRKSSSRQSLEYSNLDFTTSINTEFSSLEPCNQTSSEAGYEFQRWFEDVEEFPQNTSDDNPGNNSSVVNDLTMFSNSSGGRSRSWSIGEPSGLDMSVTEDEATDQMPSSKVWCLASMHGQVVTGCGDGRIEVWEAETGELRYHYSISQAGVTGLCVVANKIVAARLDGSLDFLEMETFQSPVKMPPPCSPPGRQKRGHTRNYSSGSTDSCSLWDEVLRCSGATTVRAHQLPINAVQCAGGRIVTASQDHTLKVFRLDNSLCLYTLHGHEGSVTALFLDEVAPYAAMSGSVDGSVRLWDLLTGTCIHKFNWHDAAVVSLMASPLYIASIGLDDKMCVYERTKSVLLHTITLEPGGVGSATLMSRNLVVTGGQNSISLWDIPRGSLLRKVVFSDSEHQSFPNHIVPVANNGVVCDQGQDLKVVFFPTILEKAE